MKFFRARVLLWPMLLLVIAITGAGICGIVMLWLASPFSLTTQSRSTQTVESMERRGDVVVLGLDVVAVDDDKTNLKFYGLDVLGTNRALFLRYEFDAKLGFSGEDVDITASEDGSTIHVSVPRFNFIGTDNFDSEIAAEENGILGWLTPDIDDREMADKFLDAAKKQEYLDKNVETLQQNTEAFYTEIVTAIDPSITLTFEFAQ